MNVSVFDSRSLTNEKQVSRGSISDLIVLDEPHGGPLMRDPSDARLRTSAILTEDLLRLPGSVLKSFR
jgi:hypothetical protein